MEISEYCREIENYLCRKNDGHLIRVVGPSFELVSRWADQGVPLKVACAGIDRYFERYYRSGPRRRPVRIDFCEADVLDLFDEWKRAVGAHALHTSDADFDPRSAEPRRSSLPAHLERVVTRLTSARASGAIGAAFDGLIDRVAAELDAARAKAGGVRGGARQALVDRLHAIDGEMLQLARTSLGDGELRDLAREADAELAPFRSAIGGEAFDRARDAAIDRLVRDRFSLPTIAFTA